MHLRDCGLRLEASGQSSGNTVFAEEVDRETSMNLKDVSEICAAIITSLGGGGFLVYSLSGFLGKVWADRALTTQKQEYAQLNIHLQNQLGDASRRLQIELDALGLAHKLRTEWEFQRLSELWKRIANLQNNFNSINRTGLALRYENAEEQKQFEEKIRQGFEKWLNDCKQYFYEEMLFIPKDIATEVQRTLNSADFESYNFALLGKFIGQPRNGSDEYFKGLNACRNQFNESVANLESLIREHISGQHAKSESPAN